MDISKAAQILGTSDRRSYQVLSKVRTGRMKVSRQIGNPFVRYLERPLSLENRNEEVGNIESAKKSMEVMLQIDSSCHDWLKSQGPVMMIVRVIYETL